MNHFLSDPSAGAGQYDERPVRKDGEGRYCGAGRGRVRTQRAGGAAADERQTMRLKKVHGMKRGLPEVLLFSMT